MKTIFNLFCIVGAFTLGFNAQGVKVPDGGDADVSISHQPHDGPLSSLVCIGHCEPIERLTVSDRKVFMAKVSERVASYETTVSTARTLDEEDAEMVLRPGMLGFRYEIIRETEDPKQIAKAARQFPNGWVWGLFDGGKHVAMPIADDRIPSSELLDWWQQHEPERFQNYMSNGPY